MIKKLNTVNINNHSIKKILPNCYYYGFSFYCYRQLAIQDDNRLKFCPFTMKLGTFDCL